MVAARKRQSTMKRICYILLIAALTLNLSVGAWIYLANAETAQKEDIYGNLELFTRALERVRRDWVDGENLSYQQLIHNALRGMISDLDPHSEFLDAPKSGELKEDMEGTFGGVGLVLSPRDDVLTVIAPMEDTPAFKAGIMAGDEIIRIDGRNAERLNISEAVRLLRGAPGTDVEVTTRRPSTGEVRDVKLTRAVIKVDTVKDLQNGREFPLLENGIGYVRITQFGEQTGRELDEALRKLEKRGMYSLVLDLRGNPGGLLEQAIRVCEQFLPKDQLIVTTEGRHAEDRTEYRTRSRGRHSDLLIAILVNIGSASASEIVAGCLQDHSAKGVARAIIVGEQTFGKGSVQKIIPFPSGDALRLTTARYYTPSHRKIHGEGITPDCVVPMSPLEEEALFFRVRGGIDLAPEARQATLASAKDTQLERAVDLLRGVGLMTRRAAKADHAAVRKAEPETAAR